MAKTLDERRREVEDIPIRHCLKHDVTFKGVVCVKCYDEQTIRVEHESLPLRLANTTSALRAWVLKTLSEGNGHGKPH